MAYERRSFAGGAVQASLLGDITSSSTTILIDNAAGWPNGTNGKFLVVIDRGNASEEKMLVQSLSGTTLQLASASDRGADNTTAGPHSAGAKVEHVGGAIDADEANNAVANTIGKVTTKGDMIVASASNAFVRVGVGSNSTALVADSSQTGGVKWTLLSESSLAGSVAGSGLSGGAGSPLAVNVDGSTLEVNADTVRVKDAGIVTAKLADASVTVAKLAQGVAEGTMAAPTTVGSTQLFAASEVMIGTLTNYVFTAVAGRRYAVHVLLDFQVGTAGDMSEVKIRDGGASAPTTSSTQLGSTIYVCGGGPSSTSGRDTRYVAMPVSGLSAGTHTLNLSVLRGAGSAGNDAIMSGQIWVTDIGT